MSVLVYDTNSVNRKQQFDYWNDLVCDVFIGLSCTNKRENSLYNASLTFLNMENIEVSMVECEQSQVQRTHHHIAAATDDVFMLHLQLEGTSFHSQSGYDSILTPGDFALCQSSLPYTLSFDHAIKMMVVKIPYSLMQSHIAQPELLSGLKVARSQGISGLLVNHLTELWSLRDVLDDTVYRKSLGETVTALLTSSVQQAHPDLFGQVHQPIKETQIMRLKNYIDKNLANPDLSPSLIADANGISRRYMRKIFSDAGITCQHHIINQRVNAIANELKDAKTSSLNISSVAFKWGFNNLSHFSSSFKKVKGICPKDYRSKHNLNRHR